VIQLNRREKTAVIAAAGVAVLFVFLQFILFPALDRKEVLQRQRTAHLQALAEIKKLRSEYDQLQRIAERSRSRVAAQKRGFSLFSFLDQAAGTTRIKKYIVYMKPSTSTQKESRFRISSVEMKLEAIPLDRMIRYLHAVETSEHLVDVRRLSLTRTGKKEKYLDAILEIQTLDLS
jgi:general secretion pathway protein M